MKIFLEIAWKFGELSHFSYFHQTLTFKMISANVKNCFMSSKIKKKLRIFQNIFEKLKTICCKWIQSQNFQMAKKSEGQIL